MYIDKGYFSDEIWIKPKDKGRTPVRWTRRSQTLHEEGTEINLRWDKRASTRRGLEVPIYMTPRNTLSVILGRTHDISLGGMRVKTEMRPLPFRKGDEVNFIVNEDLLILEGQGNIIWTSPIGVAVGIKFNQLTEKTTRSLEQFLKL